MNAGVQAARPLLAFEALLAFEEDHPRHTGAKELAIREVLGVAPARYYQLLFRAVRTLDAARINPQVTHRVLRQLEADADRRSRIQ